MVVPKTETSGPTTRRRLGGRTRPYASAAEVLAGSLGVECENTTKWLHESVGAGATNRATARERVVAARSKATRNANRLDDALTQIDSSQQRWTMQPGQLVIVDEASLAGTLSIAALAYQVEVAGATLLLVGDHGQLSAVDAGGALRMLAAAPGVAELSNVWRFEAEWERAASLALRDGDHRAIHDYLDHDRISEGDYAAMLDAAYGGWLDDTQAGLTSLLIAGDHATVHDSTSFPAATWHSPGTSRSTGSKSATAPRSGSAIGSSPAGTTDHCATARVGFATATCSR